MEFEKQIKHMLEVIEQEVEYTQDYLGKKKLDQRVLNAMKKVPRHEFIPADHQHMAYIDGPVSIGYGQTISQPYIVAIMTDLLDPQPDDTVLEVGTGSGYQAAVLSLLVRQVYTTEDVSALVESASERLQRLGYKNIEVQERDGYYGLPEHAPFDGIIVTAASLHIPLPLVEQLKPNARLIIPVVQAGYAQKLKLIQKLKSGRIKQRDILDVAFVPLTGDGHDQAAK